MDVKRTMKNVELKLKEVSPDIMLVAGIALSAASIVMFCKKTKKAEPIVESYKNNIDSVADDHDHDCCDDKTYRKVVIGETMKAAGALGKVYWLPTLMWGASTGLIIGSHHILKDRAVTYAAIASGLSMELRNLHQRIVEKYGEDIDKELTYGEFKEVETKRIDEETGEEVVEKSMVSTFKPIGGPSVFARFFDEGCGGFEKNSEYNKSWLLSREAEINLMWRAMNKGEALLINDIYDKCGMSRTELGGICGYVKGDPLAPDYISLGIFNNYNQGQRDAVNGYNYVFLIDPTTPTIVYNTEQIVSKLGYAKADVLVKSVKG